MKKYLIYLGAVLVAILGVYRPIRLAAAEDFVEESEESEVEISEKIPELFIKAVNPGYAGDLGSNVGEMIEIARKKADEPILLAGTTVSYTNSSGKESDLFVFPENSWMTGETILLRLASSPDKELANATYTKTLAMNGELKLKVKGEVVDEVCWTGKAGCAKQFKSVEPTTLVRILKTGEWEHLEEYEPDFGPENYSTPEVEEKDVASAELAPQCRGIQFSEVLSYYESAKAEQFIELYNPRTEEIRLDGCVVKYKNKNHVLSGTVGPEGYHAYYVEANGFSLTKNPTSSNELVLIDVNGAEVDKMEYPNGQRKGTSYALIGHDEKGEEVWKVTYAPTPGEANNYQEFKSCEVGKVLNQATGNCVKAVALSSTTCKEGYIMNPLTGRCNKIKTSTTSECKEGYYRDPTTNRCRKVKDNDGAGFAMQPQEVSESTSFIALYAVLGVAAVGGVYLIYEFRQDIARKGREVLRRVKRR